MEKRLIIQAIASYIDGEWWACDYHNVTMLHKLCKDQKLARIHPKAINDDALIKDNQIIKGYISDEGTFFIPIDQITDDIPEPLKLLIQEIIEMGWNIAIPKGDENVKGVIVGEESYVNKILSYLPDKLKI